MTAKEYIKIVQDKREMLKEIMIDGMKHWDKQRDVDAYYELYIDLSDEDLNPIWCYWIDCNSSKDTSNSDLLDVLKLGPHGSWTEWIDTIDLAADLIGLSADDLITAARPWLESEGYIDSDDEIDISHIDLWVSGDPDDPITQKLLNAWAESIDRDYNDVYSDRADRAIDELMRRLQEYARDEEEQEAERAAWARGEVW